MRLYSFALSGHAHRVRLFLSLIGIDADIVDLDLGAGEHKTPEFLALNRFGQEAYGNCPQFIRLRDHRFDRSPSRPSPDDAIHLAELDAEAIALIRTADTFFVASYADVAGERQVDVSHRGGMPGFVEISADGLLTIPDYRGNRHFNTLGNILTNPRAGLLFIDFETGDLLQLSGEAAIDSDALAASQRIGAERLWTFRPRRIVRRKSGSPLRWIAQENGHSHSSLATLPDHDLMQPKG